MTKLFFDVVGPEKVRFDFRGELVESVEEARYRAELLSLDVACRDENQWDGGEVRVSDERGECVYSHPICALN